MLGRRRPNTPRDTLPEDIRAGDYWKVLETGSNEPAHSNSPSNLTGTCWMVVAPMDFEEDHGWMIGHLVNHTVREHEDGTISVRAGDGSTNSILITGAFGKTWHGYIEHGVWQN